jgi:hypothetical protein
MTNDPNVRDLTLVPSRSGVKQLSFAIDLGEDGWK